jgi:hypothetical protein
MSKLFENGYSDVRKASVNIVSRITSDFLTSTIDFKNYFNNANKDLRDSIIENLSKSFSEFYTKYALLK